MNKAVVLCVALLVAVAVIAKADIIEDAETLIAETTDLINTVTVADPIHMKDRETIHNAEIASYVSGLPQTSAQALINTPEMEHLENEDKNGSNSAPHMKTYSKLAEAHDMIKTSERAPKVALHSVKAHRDQSMQFIHSASKYQNPAEQKRLADNMKTECVEECGMPGMNKEQSRELTGCNCAEVYAAQSKSALESSTSFLEIQKESKFRLGGAKAHTLSPDSAIELLEVDSSSADDAHSVQMDGAWSSFISEISNAHDNLHQEISDEKIRHFLIRRELEEKDNAIINASNVALHGRVGGK